MQQSLEIVVKYKMNLFKICFILSILTLSTMNTYAQRYNGVQMKSSKAYKYKEKTLVYHQLSIGIDLPGSNYNVDDIFNYENENAYNIKVPALSINYTLGGAKWEWKINAMYERHVFYYPKHLLEERIYDHARLYTLNIGTNYKWKSGENWQLYSGFLIGGRVLFEKYQTASSSELINQNSIQASYYLSPIGFNYRYKGFGTFIECGYGTHGVLKAGFLYRIGKDNSV